MVSSFIAGRLISLTSSQTQGEAFDPIMDENPELSNFRKQWQEEVRNRGQGSGGHQHQQLPSQSQQRASFSHPFRRRLPSFNSTLPPRLTHSRHNSGDARPTHDESLVPSHPETDIEQEALSASASTGQKAPILHPDEFAADKGTPRTALEHYERAAEKESQGSLGESLSLYRKAFRVNLDSMF